MIIGSLFILCFYMIINADLTSKIDDLCDETEEDIRQSKANNHEVKRLQLKEKIILAWKLLRFGYRCLIVFWSRVPTTYELEHRQIASMCRVVEDGREMMDAMQNAANINMDGNDIILNRQHSKAE